MVPLNGNWTSNPAQTKRLLRTDSTLNVTLRLHSQKKVLSRPVYAKLVRVVTDRLPADKFFELIASHQSVLSPPGRGFDCWRTWQALAVGTVPLVVHDATFDLRLFEGTGAEFFPFPEDITSERLETVLLNLKDPNPCRPFVGDRPDAPNTSKLKMFHWERDWAEALDI